MPRGPSPGRKRQKRHMIKSLVLRTGIVAAAKPRSPCMLPRRRPSSASRSPAHRSPCTISSATSQSNRGSGSDVVVEVTRGGHAMRGRLSLEVREVRGRNTLCVRFLDASTSSIPTSAAGRVLDFRIGSDCTLGGDDRDDCDDRSWGGHRICVKGGGQRHGGSVGRIPQDLSFRRARISRSILGVGELGCKSRATADLKMSAGSGRVTIRDVKGNLVATTGSGGMDVRGANGDEVRITTGSGGITANDVSGKRLRVSTGSGGVTGGGFTSEDLEISSGSGSIRVDDARAPRAHLSSGSGGIRVGFASPVKSLDASYRLRRSYCIAAGRSERGCRCRDRQRRD